MEARFSQIQSHIYFLPLVDVGSGPIISQDNLSKGHVALIVPSGAGGFGCEGISRPVKFNFDSIKCFLNLHMAQMIMDLSKYCSLETLYMGLLFG